MSLSHRRTYVRRSFLPVLCLLTGIALCGLGIVAGVDNTAPTTGHLPVQSSYGDTLLQGKNTAPMSQQTLGNGCLKRDAAQQCGERLFH